MSPGIFSTRYRTIIIIYAVTGVYIGSNRLNNFVSDHKQDYNRFNQLDTRFCNIPPSIIWSIWEENLTHTFDKESIIALQHYIVKTDIYLGNSRNEMPSNKRTNPRPGSRHRSSRQRMSRSCLKYSSFLEQQDKSCSLPCPQKQRHGPRIVQWVWQYHLQYTCRWQIETSDFSFLSRN